MNLSEKLAAAAAEHGDRAQAMRGSLEAHADRIAVNVEAHALQYLKNLLANGMEQGLAVASAEAEALRYRNHLVTSVALVADPAVQNVDLHCANCRTVTPHARVVDTNAETVCTCVCGRFRKFAAGVEPADAAPEE